NVVSLDESEKTIQTFDLIIQTSSVGMKPNVDAKIISLQSVSKGTIVSDIVYQPLKTALLQQAQDQEARIHLGHSMLLYQAQYAFEIWTGYRHKMDTLDEQLKKELEGLFNC